MKTSSCLSIAALLALCLLLIACQGTIEDPELAALIDEYESIVDQHEGRMAGSRGNPAQMATQVTAFNAEVSEWAEKFRAKSREEISPEDARKVQRRLDGLNRRVEKMITG